MSPKILIFLSPLDSRRIFFLIYFNEWAILFTKQNDNTDNTNKQQSCKPTSKFKPKIPTAIKFNKTNVQDPILNRIHYISSQNQCISHILHDSQDNFNIRLNFSPHCVGDKNIFHLRYIPLILDIIW